MGHCGCDTLVVPELKRKNEFVCGYLKCLSVPCSSHSYLAFLSARMLQIMSNGSKPKSDRLFFTSLTYVLHIQALCSFFKIKKVNFFSQMSAHNFHSPDFNLILV